MKENTGKKRKTIIAAVLATVLLLAVFLWLIPALHEKACMDRVYNDMDADLNTVQNASIRIIHMLEKQDGSYSCSAGASGVIIAREGSRYFVLTAAHVVSNPELKHIIMTALTPAWEEYQRTGSIDAYYAEMPEAEVVYFDEEYDLALLAFDSAEELAVAETAGRNPAKGDRIALIASRFEDGKRIFARNFGKVTSGETERFEPGGGYHPSMVLKMNAYIADGSSGGAVYNEEMQLAGMVIGGDFDFLGRFRSGIFMPAEEIGICLQRRQDAETAKISFNFSR